MQYCQGGCCALVLMRINIYNMRDQCSQHLLLLACCAAVVCSSPPPFFLLGAGIILEDEGCDGTRRCRQHCIIFIIDGHSIGKTNEPFSGSAGSRNYVLHVE
jgi:hypothetical protein